MSSGFNGFLMLNKEIKRHEYFTDFKTFHLFMYLVLDANFTAGNFRGVEVKRGQIITSLNSLVRETGLTEREVRTALEKLIKSNDIVKKATNKNTLLTVVKYEYYTSSNDNKDKQKTNQRQTKDKPTTIIEEINNLKKEEFKKIERVNNSSLSHFDYLFFKFKDEVLKLENEYKPKINDWDSLVIKFNLKKVDKFHIDHLKVYIDNWLINLSNFQSKNNNSNEISNNHPSRKKLG